MAYQCKIMKIGKKFLKFVIYNPQNNVCDYVYRVPWFNKELITQCYSESYYSHRRTWQATVMSRPLYAEMLDTELLAMDADVINLKLADLFRGGQHFGRKKILKSAILKDKAAKFI